VTEDVGEIHNDNIFGGKPLVFKKCEILKVLLRDGETQSINPFRL